MVSDDVFWQGCFYSFLREGNGLTAEGTWFEDDCLLRERQRIKKAWYREQLLGDTGAGTKK